MGFHFGKVAISLFVLMLFFRYATELFRIETIQSEISYLRRMPAQRKTACKNLPLVFLQKISAPVNQILKPKVILAWTRWFGERFSNRWLKQCADFLDGMPCTVETNRNLSTSADAIVFHMRDFSWSDIPNQSQRSFTQRYVFLLYESPAHTHVDLKLPIAKGFFNWTQTYRRDSDINDPYGAIIPISKSYSNQSIDPLISRKSKMAAIFVSNCGTHSGREAIVRALQNYMNIDVYGQCGPLKCTRGKIACHEMLEKDYRFYLAFENSVCTDYVTEKFFYHISVNVVPIVLFGENYKSIAPEHSFIAVDSFKSIKDLADYLKYLATNVTAYKEYFKWKDKFQLINAEPSLCGICAALWANERATSVISDIYEWWIEKGKCVPNWLAAKFPVA